MNILMLTPYLPYPLLSGGQIRTYNLLKKLSKNHTITLFALIKEDHERQYIPELEKYCSSIQVFKRSRKPFTLRNIISTLISGLPFLIIRNYVPEVIAAVEQQLKREKYDVIHAETFYMMPHLPQTKIPTILVEQTIEYLGYESYAQGLAIPFLRPLLQWDVNKIKKWELHYWENCTKLIVMSEHDKKAVMNHIKDPLKVDVVANGVDTAWFSHKEKNLPQQNTILSVGTFNWLPNVEAVTFLVEKIWPLITHQDKSIQLWIVGNAPTPKVLSYAKDDSNISVTGGIPDIRDAFHGAHVLIAPVFSGKGTRYKILEAMASHTPIVATTTAVEGLGVEHNTHILLADSAEDLASETLRLLKDPALQKKLAKNGFEFVSSHFDWKEITANLDSIYKQLGKAS